jgi:hypothetical protein
MTSSKFSKGRWLISKQSQNSKQISTKSSNSADSTWSTATAANIATQSSPQIAK